MARIHRRTVQKDLHDPDNHDGVITHTHLELDILECEIRWALGSITMNKASGGDGIPVELGHVQPSICTGACTVQYIYQIYIRQMYRVHVIVKGMH